MTVETSKDAPVGQVPTGEPPKVGARRTRTVRVSLASYGRRVAAVLIDGAVEGLPTLLGYGAVLALSGTADAGPGSVIGTGGAVLTLLAVVLGHLTTVTVQIQNRIIRQGRTGQSIGKQAMRIAVLTLAGRQPMGAGVAFARCLGHLLDALSVVGFLWPLWDARRQTFADMICGTIVVVAEPRRPRRRPAR